MLKLEKIKLKKTATVLTENELKRILGGASGQKLCADTDSNKCSEGLCTQPGSYGGTGFKKCEQRSTYVPGLGTVSYCTCV